MPLKFGTGLEKVRSDSTRIAQWRVIRAYCKRGMSFTVTEIAMSTDVAPMTVRKFLNELARAGVVKKGTKASLGKQYALIKDIGPKVPVRARPLSHSLTNAYWLPSGADWGMEAHAFALDELDKRYSFQNLWKTWLGLNLVRREYQCAQYVAAVLAKAGVALSMPATPESVAREMMARLPAREALPIIYSS